MSVAERMAGKRICVCTGSGGVEAEDHDVGGDRDRPRGEGPRRSPS